METLSKEYGWLPSDIKKQDNYDILAYLKIISIKRRIDKAERSKNKFKK